MAFACLPVALGAQALPTTLEGLRWRHIGPAAYGGRIADLAIDPRNPSTVYVGAASGGIFKSVNAGATWTPVFDETSGAQSIGALAIAPSDPNVIWAGTGEANNRQSSSWGNGVYRSVDAGRTWEALGLAETHHIGRIVVHPTDPNTAWVAAVGHLWGPNAERGLFRTRDGGRTWDHVLRIDQNTGATDVILDPDGRTLVVATYQRQRRAFGFDGGGPGSGLHRSSDGGDTWQRLASGLPTGDIGRIGLAQAPNKPDVMYAVIEHARLGGVHRSDDRGVTWRRVNPINPRPMYYSNLRVDPTDAEHLWMLDAYLFESRDGGKTLASDSTGAGIHVDHHALWINPRDPKHMLLGNDGGLYVTHDGSRTWRMFDNIPIGQYYDIAVDRRSPYRIYGGTQDNGTWAVPSRSWNEAGITNDQVTHLAYGDGFYAMPDPANPRMAYANSQNGRAYFVDLETKEQRLIRPAPADTSETYRFGWATPAMTSPHDPNTYYYGGNRLFRTRNRGQGWDVISPDMSRRQASTSLPIMGRLRDSLTLSRDDGVSDYGVITTISESPRHAGRILLGTDDGLVHLTRDGGATWRDITSSIGVSGTPWVSRVLLSEHDPQVAWAAFDAHQDDDFSFLLYRTADGGTSWQRVGAQVPSGYVINAIAEHPDARDVLFVGTESGLVISYDAGRTWAQPRGTLPRVPVDDIVIHPDTKDVVLGTHGRSLIVLDDARVLALGDPSKSAALRLATPSPATLGYVARAIPSAGAARYAGDNAPPGALITYVLPAGAPDSVTITMRDARGTQVAQVRGSGGAGVHRVSWDLRHPLPYKPVAADAVWFGPPKGAWVLPGSYRLTLASGSTESHATLVVRPDSRVARAA
ncbi:MAG: glycosyl hydrolase, partial [Cytophagaceae bacterium]|nr:glycosyl hydrolase [Gemmatimonadaceae bacterium]